MKITFTEKFWNFFFSITFVTLSVLAWLLLKNFNIKIEEISLFDLLILGLATYRLTRLIIFDYVFNYIRDLILKSRSSSGLIKTLSFLITCPWCVSMWMGLVLVPAYLLLSYGKLLAVILAISALANIFQLFVSLIGWYKDEKKIEFKKLKEKIDNEKRSSVYYGEVSEYQD